MITHKSDCATHNAPAMEPGPCDCGARLAEIRARVDAATPGPWNADDKGGVGKAEVTGEDRQGYPIWDLMHVADASPVDAELIAHARTDIPYLLSEIDRLRGHVCATPHCAECKAKEDANRRRLEAKP